MDKKPSEKVSACFSLDVQVAQGYKISSTHKFVSNSLTASVHLETHWNFTSTNVRHENEDTAFGVCKVF